MEDPVKLVGIAVGTLTVFAGAARWLISKYFEIQSRLEALKEQNTKDALADLDTLAAGLRTGLTSLTDEVRELRKEVEAMRHVAQELQTNQSIIEKRLRPFAGKKLVRFSENLYALKKKE